MAKTDAPAARVLRTRSLAAATRSLKLIQGAVAEHAALLAEKKVPGTTFLTSVLKYEQALDRVSLVDQITGPVTEEDTEPDPALVQVSREDVAILVEFAHQFITPESRGEDSPVTRLEAALNGSPAEAGEPA